MAHRLSSNDMRDSAAAAVFLLPMSPFMMRFLLWYLPLWTHDAAGDGTVFKRYFGFHDIAVMKVIFVMFRSPSDDDTALFFSELRMK